MKNNISLFDHQKKALDFLRLNDFFALFMEQGCGKTLPTIERIHELILYGKITNALIIAPKSAMGAWNRDIENFYTIEEQHILNKYITVINYDKVWRGKEKSPYYKTWDCIVLDEAHYIKNRSSERSKFILKLATKSKYKYILTGTPIGNGQLENIWSEYAFLSPKIDKRSIYSNIFEGTYKDFTDKYCLLDQYYKPRQYLNVNELQQIIDEYSYRVKKEDCLDLPDKLPDQIIEIELAEPKLYKSLIKDSALLEYDILAENALSRMIKARQLVSGVIRSPDGDIKCKCNKIKELDAILSDYDKKLVIFAQFKTSIADITSLLKKRKIKHVVLDGDQKNKMIWRDFQKDPKIKVIVVQYESGAAGIDLYAADTILYYEPTTRSTTLEQSRDRIHRTGQKNACSYLHFITKGTIETQIFKVLQGYGDFSEKLFTEYIETYTRSYNK